MTPTLFDDPMPYGGTSGWSGSETSRARAVAEDESGSTKWRDDAALAFLERQGERGLTWREFGDALHLHHGQSSACLSRLHKMGRIARLTETRERCQVYVALPFIRGRETSPYRPNVSARLLVDTLHAIRDDLDAGRIGLIHARIDGILAIYEGT